MNKAHLEIIAGLDLGSTHFRVAIGRRCEEGIEIIGVGQISSLGMRKGERSTLITLPTPRLLRSGA